MAHAERSRGTREPLARRNSPPPVEATSSKGQSRLRLLLAAHVILGLVFCAWSASAGRTVLVLGYVLVVPVFGIVLAQTSLLGFWVAFSSAARGVRLMGLIAGSICLELLLGIGAQDDDYAFLATMTTGGIAAVFGVVRWRHADLRHFPQQAPRIGQEGMQLSIRGLMLFTFIVAVTIIGAGEFRENVPRGPSLFRVSSWSLCSVVVGIAGVWAGLGLGRPMLRSAVVLLIAAVLGALFAHGIHRSHPQLYSYIIPMMLLQAGVLVASLLVVRSCGYRLVRKSASDVAETS